MFGLPSGMADPASRRRFASARSTLTAACARSTASLAHGSAGSARPQQRLYFLPLPQGQGSLRPVGARFGGEARHDLARLAAALEDLGHQAHRPLGVREEAP